MKVKLIAWMTLLLMLLVAGTWSLFSLKPSHKIDCKKVIEAWNYYEGQAAIAAFKGDDINKQLLQGSYIRLVINNGACFPPKLVEYIQSL